MIFNDRKYEWHKWFAWYPVRLYHEYLLTPTSQWAWLSVVERKCVRFYGDNWYYKGSS